MIVIAGREFGRVGDVAEAFGRSKDTIWRWDRMGILRSDTTWAGEKIWDMKKVQEKVAKKRVGRPSRSFD